MDHRDLFSDLVDEPNEVTIDYRFARFDEANPHVYKMFVKFAMDARARGLDHYSARTIIERMRWHYDVETVDTDQAGFKLNDHFTSRYARKMIGDYPEFDGFFELRALTAQLKAVADDFPPKKRG